jgi:hypothetical protein
VTRQPSAQITWRPTSAALADIRSQRTMPSACGGALPASTALRTEPASVPVSFTPPGCSPTTDLALFGSAVQRLSRAASRSDTGSAVLVPTADRGDISRALGTLRPADQPPRPPSPKPNGPSTWCCHPEPPRMSSGRSMTNRSQPRRDRRALLSLILLRPVEGSQLTQPGGSPTPAVRPCPQEGRPAEQAAWVRRRSGAAIRSRS